MAISHVHTAAEASKPARGTLTSELLKWKADSSWLTPFAASNGPEAASSILLKAHALTACMAAAFDGKVDAEFDLLSDNFKALAMEGIGDLILLAKALTDEA